MKYYCIACVAGAFIVLCYLLFHPVHVGSYVRLESDGLASNAGVYRKQACPKYTKDVIVMVANYGVLDFIVNWMCSYDTSNIKFVVVSLDKKLHDHIQKYTKITSIDGSRFNASAGSKTSNFMTGEFNTISHMTVKCIHGILSEGYNVFFTDVDVAWLRDPIPYFQRDVDFEFQSENYNLEVGKINTGFYYARSNARSIAFMEDVVQYTAMHPEQHNQQRISDKITTMEKRSEAVFVLSNSTSVDKEILTFRQLSPMLFATGCRFFKEDYFKRMSEAGLPPVVMHFNCIGKADKKRERMKSYGMWRVAKSEVSCGGSDNCYGQVGDQWLSCTEH